MKVLEVRLNDEEESVVAELLARGGFKSEEHIAKLGLYKVAEHFDIPVSVEAFTIPYHARMRVMLEKEPRRGVLVSPLFADLPKAEGE